MRLTSCVAGKLETTPPDALEVSLATLTFSWSFVTFDDALLVDADQAAVVEALSRTGSVALGSGSGGTAEAAEPAIAPGARTDTTKIDFFHRWARVGERRPARRSALEVARSAAALCPDTEMGRRDAVEAGNRPMENGAGWIR